MGMLSNGLSRWFYRTFCGHIRVRLNHLNLQLINLHTLLKGIAMNTQEALDKITETNAKLDAATSIIEKISGETSGLVTANAELAQALADAIASGGTITPELEAAISASTAKADAVVAAASGVDAQVADSPAPEAPVGDVAP